MAGTRFDLSEFRLTFVDQLPLQLPPILINPDGVPESMRRVNLFRTTDLLSLQVSFVGLTIEDTEEGRILRRADDAATGFLRVHFRGQHLHEEAFFETSKGISVNPPPSPASDPTRVADIRDATAGGETPRQPPVQSRIAGATRLVFVVTTERIPFTRDGLLLALTTLPLSVVPHAARSSQERLVISLPPGLGNLVAVGPGDVVLQEAGDPLRMSGRLQAGGRTLGAAAALQSRFGSSAAASALLAADAGSSTFSLVEDAIGRLGGIVDERFVVTGDRPPIPREPAATETAIELPWRLQLSPHADGGFAHASTPAESADGRVELWHTRLGSHVPAEVAGEVVTGGGVDENRRDERTVRAVWTRDFVETPNFTFHPAPLPLSPPGSPKEFPDANQSADQPRFRSALNSRDRMMLVHETSNFHLQRPSGARYEPPPVEVDRLMLSALGGSLASQWATSSPPRGNTTIQEWVHRAALGRDNYVKVVYAGFLLPFLHAASLVKVTERRISGGIAYLFQRMYVVVRQPVRSYGATPEKDKKIDRGMPFSSVRILTSSTPDLDEPNDLSADVPGLMFTPVVGGGKFRFRMLGVDMVGRLVEFDGPLVFAEYDHNADGAVDTMITAYASEIPSFALRGQKVAYAPSATADDTTLATQTMSFNVVTSPQIQLRPQDRARLEPTLREANVVVPAMSALAGAGAGVLVQYPDAYLTNQFSGNPAEVFLELKKKAPLDFSTQSDRSGGFVAPSLNVCALSRTLGPMGSSVDRLFAGGQPFDISQYFPSSAKLFGLVNLFELIPNDFTPATLPRFVAQSFDAATMFATNLEQLAGLAGRLAGVPEAAPLAGQLQAVADTAASLLAAVAGGADPGPAIASLKSAIATLLPGLASADALLRSDREALSATLARLGDQLAAEADLIKVIQDAAAGAVLPETVRARLDWSTELRRWPASDSIFVPDGAGRLSLAVDVQAPTVPGGEPSALVSCAISPFELRLIGDDPFLILAFEKLEFSAVPGAKTDVNVVFRNPKGVVFAGPLSFVETLRSIIPFDGFSDPPYLDVSPAGIRAGFDLAIPTVAMGVFALSNITFSAAVEVPFIGESIAVRFAFSSQENPFRLQVALFAGGGYFVIVITPKEVRRLEASLEFGAAVALNFGVASGSVSVMAGIAFVLRSQGGVTDTQLTGFFRARGEVDVLGLITASIEISLDLTYETGSGKAVGRASISVEVSVCMLSFSVSISCEKKFAGSAGDPTFAEVMGRHPVAAPETTRPWDDYCDAFAA